MANQMIQRIAAQTYLARVTGARIIHPQYKDWKISQSRNYQLQSLLFRVEAKLRPKSTLFLNGNKFSPSNLGHNLIILGGNALRLEYLSPSRDFAREYFPISNKCACCQPLPSDMNFSMFNVTHVRLGDIWDGSYANKGYVILPISFYEDVYAISQKPFLIVSESPTNEQETYIQKIISLAPGSFRLSDGCLVRDFQLLRTAETITIATSTFSWLAAWLSEYKKELFIPKIGLFDVKHRPDIDLISDLNFFTVLDVDWNNDL
jgi:hypothetical protein